MPFGATWIDLEIIILSELSQRKTNILWYHLQIESIKKDTNELIYKAETDSLRKLTQLPEGKRGQERNRLEFGD